MAQKKPKTPPPRSPSKPKTKAQLGRLRALRRAAKLSAVACRGAGLTTKRPNRKDP